MSDHHDAGASKPPPRLSPTLLPPGSGLAPPGNTVGRMKQGLEGPSGSDPLIDEIGSSLARAGETSRLLAARAIGTAVEHAPELQRRASAAASIAGEQARVAFKHATSASQTARTKWEATASQPQQRKRLVFGGGIAVIVLLVALWFVAQLHATSVARAQIPVFLARAGLASTVSYHSISASPFGSVKLEGVGFRSGRLLIPIESVTLDRYTAGAAGLRDLAVTVRQASVPLSSLRNILPPPLVNTLAGLGIIKPMIDADLDCSVDEGTGTLLASSTIDSNDFGRIATHLKLGGANSATLGNVLTLLLAQTENVRTMYSPLNEQKLEQAAASLTTTTLLSGDMTIEDSPLAARAHDIPAISTPSDVQDAADTMISRLSSNIGNVVRPDRTEDVKQIVSKWLDHGGRITFKSEPAAPFSLFRTNAFGNSMVPTMDDPDTVAQLNMDVTN